MRKAVIPLIALLTLSSSVFAGDIRVKNSSGYNITVKYKATITYRDGTTKTDDRWRNVASPEHYQNRGIYAVRVNCGLGWGYNYFNNPYPDRILVVEYLGACGLHGDHGPRYYTHYENWN